MIKKKFWKNGLWLVILLGVCLSGCGTIAKDYKYMPESKHADENGMVLIRRIELNKPGKVVSNPEGEFSFDSREPNFWQKNVVPMVAGGLQHTEAVIN